MCPESRRPAVVPIPIPVLGLLGLSVGTIRVRAHGSDSGRDLANLSVSYIPMYVHVHAKDTTRQHTRGSGAWHVLLTKPPSLINGLEKKTGFTFDGESWFGM